MFGQECFKHMSKDKSHMIIISPPIECSTPTIGGQIIFITVFQNSICIGGSTEQKFPNVAVNTLWPRTTIDTAPYEIY